MDLADDRRVREPQTSSAGSRTTNLPCTRPRTLDPSARWSTSWTPPSPGIRHAARDRRRPARADLPRLVEEIDLRKRHALGGGASASATGSASGSPPAPPTCTSRSSPCWRSAPPTCRSTPTTRTNAPQLVFGEAEVCAVLGADRSRDRCSRRRTAPPARAPARRRRLDHLHLRLDRQAQGRRRQPPVRRRVRRRRGALFLVDEPIGTGRPGAGRALGRVRRVLRGDVAGLAPRRLPGARAALARAHRRRPRARGWSSSASPSSPRCRRWPGCGRSTRWTRSGC